MNRRRVKAEGHLIDTGLMSRFLGTIIEGGGSYEILRFDVGKTKEDFSVVELDVRAKGADPLDEILVNLATLGCRLIEEREVVLAKAPRDGVAPDGFYATTHHH